MSFEIFADKLLKAAEKFEQLTKKADSKRIQKAVKRPNKKKAHKK